MASYEDPSLKEDIKAFFLQSDHRLYKSFDPTPECTPDSPYSRKQLEVLFEDTSFHWRTDRTINNLLEEGFLKETVEKVANIEVHFVYRYNVRYLRRPIRKRMELIGRYSTPEMSKATGDYAEILFSFWLQSLGFTRIAKNARAYQGKVWTQTGHNLDFIFEKDGLGYGIEIKNTFPYMENDEFEFKTKMCEFLGLHPLFILRTAPTTQFEAIRGRGRILRFKTKAFPPGQEELTRQIWRLMRLPVVVLQDIPQRLATELVSAHEIFLNRT